MKIRLVLMGPNSALLLGLRELILTEEDMTVLDEVHRDCDVLAVTRRIKTDIVVLDSDFCQSEAMEATRQIKKLNPKIKVLFLLMPTGSASFVGECLEIGVDGFLPKDEIEKGFIDAIREVCAGGILLSPRMRKGLVSSMKVS